MNIQKTIRTNGFTLIELLISIQWLCCAMVLLLLGFVLLAGNHWFSSASVLQHIQWTEPSAKQVAYHRSVFKKSIIYVRMEDGTQKKYLLDTDILFNYELREVPFPNAVVTTP